MGVAYQVNQFWFPLIILLLSITISSISGAEPNCVYTAYIRTGPFMEDATDSKISLTLYDASGYGIRIKNLVAWGGLMGSGYNYFETDRSDMFSGHGPCLTGPICKMVLTSDGTGRHSAWYCNYVEVTSTGDHKQCSQQLFNVDQWLSTDRSPYQLTATRNNCRRMSGDQQPIVVDVI
ncbi:PLAT domain-containing protein 3-like [Nicotiana tomentosiformis]|uniref:PLAT domain-containing protein 3-like n=1 Tax=Nicotiana tomentosiformis TaxID=4098 RepID=UPI00388C716D